MLHINVTTGNTLLSKMTSDERDSFKTGCEYLRSISTEPVMAPHSPEADFELVDLKEAETGKAESSRKRKRDDAVSVQVSEDKRRRMALNEMVRIHEAITKLRGSDVWAEMKNVLRYQV